MYTPEQIDEYKQLHALFCKLYHRGDDSQALVGVMTNGVQIRAESMTQFAPLTEWTVAHRGRNAEVFPYEARAVINGVTFYAIMSATDHARLFQAGKVPASTPVAVEA